MKPAAQHRLSAFAGILVAWACACGGVNDPSGEKTSKAKVAAPEWLEHVEMRVERVQPAFDQNTEVFVTVLNRSKGLLTIQGLAAEGAVSLQHEGGAVARLHAISVGAKKPIKLESGRVKSTSLLFEAAPGAPRTLRLYDRVLAVPP